MSMKRENRAHCAAAGLLLGSTLLYSFSPVEHSFYPRCIFHALTGRGPELSLSRPAVACLYVVVLLFGVARNFALFS
jgi:hypothetical protein